MMERFESLRKETFFYFWEALHRRDLTGFFEYVSALNLMIIFLRNFNFYHDLKTIDDMKCGEYNERVSKYPVGNKNIAHKSTFL